MKNYALSKIMLLCLTILFIRQISAKAQEKETMMKVKEVFNMIERVLGVPVDQIELQMKFTDPEGKVLEKSSVTLHYNQVERTFQPEKPGLVIVELDRALIAKKATLTLKVEEYTGTIRTKFQFQCRVNTKSDLGSFKFINLQDALSKKSSRFDLTVYYFNREELSLVLKVLDITEKIYSAMHNLLRTEPIHPFGVVLTMEEGTVVVSQPNVWAYKYRKEEFEEFEAWLVHEWAEETINAFAALQRDRKNR